MKDMINQNDYFAKPPPLCYWTSSAHTSYGSRNGREIQFTLHGPDGKSLGSGRVDVTKKSSWDQVLEETKKIVAEARPDYSKGPRIVRY